MASKTKEKLEPKIFAKRAAAYFRDCDNGLASASCDTCSVEFGDEKCAVCRKKKRRPYTVSGLCLAIGINKREFDELKTNKCFSEAVEMALLKIEAYIEENSVTGAINGTLALAILKEHFGWGEKRDAPDTVTVVMSEEAEILAK